MSARGSVLIPAFCLLIFSSGCASAIHRAAYEGDTKTVLSLLDQGEDVNSKGGRRFMIANSTVLVAAIEGQQIDTVRALLARGANVNQEAGAWDHNCSPPLLCAVWQGNLQIIKLLLDHGADPNIKNWVGDTALAAAGSKKVASLEISRLLLDRGADVNHMNKDGETKLMWAARNGNAPMVELLLERGADPSIESRMCNGTALKCAEMHGQPNVARILRQAEARNIQKTNAPLPQVAAVPIPSLPAIRSDVDRVPTGKAVGKKHAYAVVIGIEQYREKLPKADYADRDAKLVGEYLTKVMGYPEENVIVQVNDRATGRDLEKYFESWLPNNVEKDGTVFVYYSGHGSPSAKSGDAYLVPYDGDPAFLETTGYPLKRLYAALEKLPAGEVTVVLDSCFSGAGGRSVIAQGLRPMGLSVEKAMKASGKTIVFSASSGEQVSSTYLDQGHGLMTYFFLKGLQGEGDTNHDGIIELAELFEYVKPNVQRIARKQYNNEQTPQLLTGTEALAKGGGRLVERAKP